jgi:hypothetical protein
MGMISFAINYQLNDICREDEEQDENAIYKKREWDNFKDGK